jgi:small-conductance mechanosensitive channel
MLATSTTTRPLTLWVERFSDSELVLWMVRFVFEPLLIVVAILLIAGVVLRVARRALRRVVGRAKEPRPIITASFRTSDDRGPEEDADEALVRQVRREQRAEALGTLTQSVVGVLVWGFAILTAVGTIGVNLGPLIAGAGVLGVAIGFGAQGIVKDFLSGVIMLVEDQYGVGDVIDAGVATGVVEEVSLRTTRLRDVTGTVWHVPNGSIARVGNMTQGWSRMVLDVEVAYETDVDHAIDVLEVLIRRVEQQEDVREMLLGDPMEIWGVHDLGDSGVAIRVVARTVPGKQWGLGRRLRLEVKREFDRVGIEIPYPQRTVWHRGLGEELPSLSDRPDPSAERATDAAPGGSDG